MRPTWLNAMAARLQLCGDIGVFDELDTLPGKIAAVLEGNTANRNPM